MRKRGQLSSETIVYALTIVIVAVILIMGYKYLSSAKKAMDKGELLQFRNKLASDAKSIGKEYGTYKKIIYSVPRNLEEVCFVDLSKKEDILASKLISFYPLVKDSLNSNLGRNIFFVGNTELQSFNIENLELNHYPFMNCFHQKNNKMNIGIEGLGGGKFLILADFMTRAKLSKDDRTILQSADEVITLEVPKGIEASAAYITVEMVEPSSTEAKKGASDLYKFGPVGTTFSKPIELRIKYNPSIAGECPQQLNFYQSSEDGNEKNIIPSKSIDCKSKVAYFDISSFI